MRQDFAKITIRISPDEYSALEVEAVKAGQSVSGYTKQRALGASVQQLPTMAACAELLAAAYALQALANAVPEHNELGDEASKHARLAIAIIRASQASADR